MARNVVKLVFLGDNKSVIRAQREIADESGRTSEKLKKHNKEAGDSFGLVGKGASGARGAIGLAFGAAGAAGVIGSVVKAGMKLQEQQATLQAAFKATGQSSAQAAYNVRAITNASDRAATHGGFATPENLQAYTQLFRATNNVTKSQQDLALATNIARGSHKDFLQVTKAVALAEQGRTTGFSRLGIVIPKITAAQDALRLSTGKHTVAQMMAAKAADAAASKVNALTVLQQKYGGATAAYGHTAAGAISNAQHAIENAGAKIGQMILPTIAKIAQFFAKWLPAAMHATISTIKDVIHFFKEHKDIALAVAAAIGVLVVGLGGLFIINTIKDMWIALDAAMAANPMAMVVIAIAAVVFGLVMLYKHSKLFRDIIQEAGRIASDVFNGIISVVSSVIGFITHHWKLLLSILTGPFGAAIIFIISHFKTVKDVLSSVFNFIVSGIRWAIGIVKKVIDTVLGPIKAVGNFIGSVGGAIGSLFGSGGGHVQHRAMGGAIGGYGGGDIVPAMLTPGEYVLRKEAVQHVGVNRLNALNQGGSMAGHGGNMAPIVMPVTLKMGARVVAEEVLHFAQKRTALA